MPGSQQLVSVQVKRRGGWLGWLFFMACLTGTLAFVRYAYLPLHKERGELRGQVDDLSQRDLRESQKLSSSEKALADLKAEHGRLTGQLVATQAEKGKLEDELKRLQTELTAKLEPEIEAGNVHVVRRGNDLVVDLADQIL